jgi:hypothetical protein
MIKVSEKFKAAMLGVGAILAGSLGVGCLLGILGFLAAFVVKVFEWSYRLLP